MDRLLLNHRKISWPLPMVTQFDLVSSTCQVVPLVPLISTIIVSIADITQEIGVLGEFFTSPIHCGRPKGEVNSSPNRKSHIHAKVLIVDLRWWRVCRFFKNSLSNEYVPAIIYIRLLRPPTSVGPCPLGISPFLPTTNSL